MPRARSTDPRQRGRAGRRRGRRAARSAPRPCAATSATFWATTLAPTSVPDDQSSRQSRSAHHRVGRRDDRPRRGGDDGRVVARADEDACRPLGQRPGGSPGEEHRARRRRRGPSLPEAAGGVPRRRHRSSDPALHLARLDGTGHRHGSVWGERRAPTRQRAAGAPDATGTPRPRPVTNEVVTVVQAYILIQTEVGRSARSREAISQIDGVTLAEDVTGPYDVIARVEAGHGRRARQARHRPDPGRRRASPARSRAPSSTSDAVPQRPDAAERRPAAVRAVPLARRRDRRPDRLLGSAVAVTAPPAAGSAACAAAAAAWPATVSGLARRDTTRASPAVAAWGDPAVIARCGVPAARPRPTDPCIEVNGVGWVETALSDGSEVHDLRDRPGDRGPRPATYAPGAAAPPRLHRPRRPCRPTAGRL